jgi:hypothetical protein
MIGQIISSPRFAASFANDVHLHCLMSGYDTATGQPFVLLLRIGRALSGAEASGYIRSFLRRIRPSVVAGPTPK